MKMKYQVALIITCLAVITILWWFTSDHPLKGTVKDQDSSGDFVTWKASPKPKDFRDGDPIGDTRDQYKVTTCGGVWWTPNNCWSAVAYPDHRHGERRYHTKEAAVKYVESWCKP